MNWRVILGELLTVEVNFFLSITKTMPPKRSVLSRTAKRCVKYAQSSSGQQTSNSEWEECWDGENANADVNAKVDKLEKALANVNLDNSGELSENALLAYLREFRKKDPSHKYEFAMGFLYGDDGNPKVNVANVATNSEVLQVLLANMAASLGTTPLRQFFNAISPPIDAKQWFKEKIGVTQCSTDPPSYRISSKSIEDVCTRLSGGKKLKKKISKK